MTGSSYGIKYREYNFQRGVIGKIEEEAVLTVYRLRKHYDKPSAYHFKKYLELLAMANQRLRHFCRFDLLFIFVFVIY